MVGIGVGVLVGVGVGVGVALKSWFHVTAGKKTEQGLVAGTALSLAEGYLPEPEQPPGTAVGFG
ncbi:MAG: hypothetical protein HY675_10125 [Chloroflexi bacterium]|nr:hypothetical protein [Chloroflexota bacterium]